ncbi:MAG: GNAT family N-acetyltransferase [Calditrichaeota bacterium]|nr:GNAT family N-acetyltransferase [Calditrichota bacterium]
MSEIVIKRAELSDFELIWPLFREIIQSGDTYAYDPDISFENARSIWINSSTHTYICLRDNQLLGTFFIKANQSGLGDHIANAGYMVSANARNQGIGRQMAEFSFEEAKRLGFQAMQFNFVVSTNFAAIELWKKLGFRIIGTIPNGFRHRQLGLVDCYVMYREL